MSVEPVDVTEGLTRSIVHLTLAIEDAVGHLNFDLAQELTGKREVLEDQLCEMLLPPQRAPTAVSETST